MTLYCQQVNTAIKKSEGNRLNYYIIDHGCSPPPRNKWVPLRTLFTPTIIYESTNNWSNAIIGAKNSLDVELRVEDDVPLMPIPRNRNSNTDDLEINLDTRI